jgi:tetratricopeptide (TPR) repeat protein
MIPVGIAVGFVILLMLSNRHVTTPEGIPVIYDPNEYNMTIEKARSITQPIFVAYDKGTEPTDAQKIELRKAALMYDAANRFDPVSMEPYFQAGKAYLIVGDYETADERLRQLVSNQIYNMNSAGEDTVAEAKNLLSIVRGLEGQWPSALELANAAVKKHPDSAVYHTTRASAELQLNLLDAAKQDLEVAHTLDPNYKRAILLNALIASDKGLSKATDKTTGK